MFNLNDLINEPLYALPQKPKEELYVRALSDITKHHYQSCTQYKKIINMFGCPLEFTNLNEIPFIPVRLFKEYELLSVEKSEVVKTMMSSGTTGQSVSKIFLDKHTAAYQTKVLTKIISAFIGVKRLPMLVIDTRSVVKDRNLFSARGAGILGFSMLGYDVTYALNEKMELDLDRVEQFLEKHQGENILIFGFTFIIWQHFYRTLEKLSIKLPLERGILIHGGGWKKLLGEAVDNSVFKSRLNNVTGLSKIFNYYGMVEQTGSIFMECEIGYLHSSIFSDVLIRDFKDFSVLSPGQQGLIQLLSLLPVSYPGHSIITEDIGKIIGVDDCPCGRKGKYFVIHGRIKKSEIRGCSDTYEQID